MTLTALTRLYSPLNRGTFEEDSPIPVLVFNLLRSAYPQLQQFSPQHLANTVYALARLKIDPGATFFDAIVDVMETHLIAGRITHPLDISMTIHSFAKLQYTPRPSFMHVLMERCLPILPRFESAQLAATVSAIAMMKVTPPSAFIQALGEQSKEIDKADCQSLSTLLYGLACLPTTTTADTTILMEMSAKILQLSIKQFSLFTEVGLVQLSLAIDRWSKGMEPSLLRHEATGPFVQALGQEALFRQKRLDDKAVVSITVALLVSHGGLSPPSPLSDLLRLLADRLPSMDPDEFYPFLTTVAYRIEDSMNVDMTDVMKALVGHRAFTSSSPEDGKPCPWTPRHLAPLYQCILRSDYDPGKEYLARSLFTVVLSSPQNVDICIFDLASILQNLSRFFQSYGHDLDPVTSLLPLVGIMQRSLKKAVEGLQGETKEDGSLSPPQAVSPTIAASLAVALEYQCYTPPVQSLLEYMITITDPLSHAHLPRANNLSGLLSALSRLRYRPHDTWMSVSAKRVEEEILTFQEQDLLMVINAWARLDWHPPQSIWQAILDQWLPANFAIQGKGGDSENDDTEGRLIFLSSVLWSLSVLDANKPSSIPIPLITALADLSKSTVEELGLYDNDSAGTTTITTTTTTSSRPSPPPFFLIIQQLAQAAFYWGSRTTTPSCNLSFAPLVQQIYSRYPRPPSPTSSKLHQQVVTTLQHMISSGGGIEGFDMVHEEVDDGRHLVDVTLSSSKAGGGPPSLAIEVDGPSHFLTNDVRQYTGDTLFKHHCMLLLPDKWVGVMSVPWFEWNEAGALSGTIQQQQMLRRKITEALAVGSKKKKAAIGIRIEKC